MPNTLLVPDSGPFALYPGMSTPRARPDGTFTVRVLGGTIISPPPRSTWTAAQGADVALVDDATTYIEISALGAIASNQTAFTGGAQQLYAITVAAGIVTAIVDWRFR